jgi:hypothetical protein
LVQAINIRPGWNYFGVNKSKIYKKNFDIENKKFSKNRKLRILLDEKF